MIWAKKKRHKTGNRKSIRLKKTLKRIMRRFRISEENG